MKIVQVNTVCNTGSTGKIVAGLYRLSKQAGHDSYIAYGRKTAPVPKDIKGYKIGNPLDFYEHVLINFFLGRSGFGSKQVTKHFLKWLDKLKPDILHLHNLHGFYIHIGMLFEYIKSHNLPIIWTLHDCWPLTGQCAFFDYVACEKWKTSCYSCPIYRSDYPYSLFKDNSQQNYIMKKEIFNGVKDMTLVTPSQWLANIVKQSFLQQYPISVIPNGIDLNIFKPYPMAPSSTTSKIILGVANVWEPRKGFNYFLQLSQTLDPSYHIVLIGVNQRQQKLIQRSYSQHITGIPRTRDQNELANWYSRSYVYFNPTLEDNFPTTNLEALACGTPVITFRTGGSPESITPQCGIVIEKGNIAEAKKALLSLKSMPISVSSCRKQAMNFDQANKFQKYLQLYAQIGMRI